MPEFTASQRNAIEYLRQDACVVAGPGSGKTTVLVERYRALIEIHRFEPREILAITFTEKAAANMKVKLAELFAHDPLRLRDLESAYVSTIDGFCARILRENAIAAGVDPRFRVLDARESEDMQFSCLGEALDELVAQRRTEALELIEALNKPDLASDLRNAYDAIRSAGKSIADVRAMPNPGNAGRPREVAENLRNLIANWPRQLSPTRQTQKSDLLAWAQRLESLEMAGLQEFAEIIDACPLRMNKVPAEEKDVLREFRQRVQELLAGAVDRHTARFRAVIFDVLARFEQLYSERKLAAGRLDFSDLERCTIHLLGGNADVRGRIRAQFRQVMLDEFQDINEQQAELMRLLRGDDVFFAVGDINQSIYAFRHARPEIFNDYRAQIVNSGKHATELAHNFRSRAEILHCVEAALNPLEGIEPRDLVPGLAFPPKAQPSIEILRIEDEDKDEAVAKEARWIAARIVELRATMRIGESGSTRPPEFRDFAVLCRNSESMKPILDAFNRAEIPYVCGRRQSFLLSREGLDITALLHTIANPRDGIALATVLRSNLVAAGDEALLRIRLLAGSLPGGLNTLRHDPGKLADFNPDDARKLERFVPNLKRWRVEQPVMPLAVLIARALSDCGIGWIAGSAAARNIDSFLQLARTKGEELGLHAFLREIKSLQNALSVESDLSDIDQGDCVQVMTAHSAKGLEFPVTIIAAMDKGTQRNAAPVTFTPGIGLGLKWKDPGGEAKSSGLDDSWQLRNTEYLNEREKREAHRLLYVAMTRAEEHLILSWSRGKNKPSNWAGLMEDFFKPGPPGAADGIRTQTITTLNGDTFDVSIRATGTDAPLVRAASAGISDAEWITVPRPAIRDQHDSAVNVTSLTVFADCPRKYYLDRYIGWTGRYSGRFDPEDSPVEGDAEPELSAAELGSAVHEILSGKTGSYAGEARRLADVFLTSDLGRRAAAAARSEREWEFIADVNGTLIRGTVDLWFEEGGEIVVVDYKTDLQPRPEAYAPQLALYTIAIERATGKRPRQAWLHFLRSNTLSAVAVDDAAIRRVEGMLAELAQAQDALNFPLREGERCRSCQFFGSQCPARLAASA